MNERILDVATELFLAQGYGLTTIEALARRAGISKRTFYHRFADKAVLFGAVVHRIVERIVQRRTCRCWKGQRRTRCSSGWPA